MGLSVIILAAGQGTRMRSSLPKVLHPLAGRPLVQHVLDTVNRLDDATLYVVYGHGGEKVREAFPGYGVNWVLQPEQLGTGHAVSQALPQIPDDHTILVVYGDVPLIGCETLQGLYSCATHGELSVLTTTLDDPHGYGRILRDSGGRITGVIEEKDASQSQRGIREVNTGFMAAPAGLLRRWVGALDNSNAQGEYYLTDIIALAADEGVTIHGVTAESAYEVQGINDRVQLAALERYFQRKQAEYWMRSGVTIADPDRFDLRGEMNAGQDVAIDVNVVLEGHVRLGDRVIIGPNTVLRNTTIADDVIVLANCVIEDAIIDSGSRIGPFSRIRPDTRLHSNTHVGNFVEIKKSDVGRGSKINHLSYIGDTSIGQNVNIGAGTITCNYDGANKYRTTIGNDVFIGSDTQLVAPVEVHDGATIGAGSTITRDAPAGELTLSRSAQMTRTGWKRPVKKT